MEILHLVSDEKFINSAQVLFSNAGIKCSWLLGQSTSQIKFVKCDETFFQFPYYSKSYKAVLNNSRWEYILVHGLSPEHLWAVLNFKGNAKLHLLSWGYDIYSLPKLRKYLYSQKTVKLIRLIGETSLIARVKVLIHQLINFPNSGLAPFVPKIWVLKRFSYLSTPIPQDFNLLTSQYILNLKYVRFNYGGSFMRRDNTNDSNDTINIILGHNAAFGNNHLDGIDFVVKQNLNFDRIYMPLSYGGNPNYIDFLVNKCENIWKDKYHPLTNFLPSNDYEAILGSVKVAVFAHTRQQALGNIISLLYNGSIIFLNPTNKIFDFLTENNVKVFNICTDSIEYALYEYTEDDINAARIFIESYFGENRLVENLNIFMTRTSDCNEKN